MSAGSVEVSDEDKRKHREAEKSLKEVRIRFHTFPPCSICHHQPYCTDHFVIFRQGKRCPHRLRYVEVIPNINVLAKPRRKVLLLGSGDSGKSTILKVHSWAYVSSSVAILIFL
jgi:ABC-type polysaccharide/polyol phosphate transport system ATPase subunit